MALNDWRFPLPLAVLSGHEKPVKSAKFSPDGNRIVTDTDGAVRIWDSMTGKLLSTLQTNGKWLCASQFSPDGQKIVTASFDQRLTGQASIKNEVARFTTGDATALIAGLDNMVQMWDGNTGKRIVNLAGNERENERSGNGGVSVAMVTGRAGHNSEVTGVEFSPDGLRIMSVTKTGSVKMWEAGTGKLLFTLQGSGYGARFSLDGERIVTVTAYEPPRCGTVMMASS